MPHVKKQILKVGTYHSPDGTVVVTPERLKHWEKNFRAMSKANLAIPSGWDHASDPEKLQPVTATVAASKKFRSAKDTAGLLKGFKVTADGTAAEILVEIPGAADAAKAKANLVQVSPVIYDNWKDGQNRTWTDVITHVDLVTHPVDSSQTPFQSAKNGEAIACSLRMGLTPKKGKAVRLSIYRLGDDMADDEESDDSDDESKDDSKDTSEETNDEGSISGVIAALAELNVILPEDTTKENFFDRVESALLTANAHRADDLDEDGDGVLDEDEEEPMKSVDPQYASMSLQVKAAHAYVQTMHRKNLEKQLDSLLDSGRCTSAEHKEQTNALGAVKLSLDNDGKSKGSKLEDWVASRAALPAGAVWDSETRTTRMGLTEQSPPSNLTGDISDEEAEKLSNFGFRKNPMYADAK